MTTQEARDLMESICALICDELPDIMETRYEITLKDDGTPVTTSDIFLEKLVHSYIKERLPDSVFIGEESFNQTIIDTENYIVLLDPIDGTENFCSGLREWGVSFGLWKGNKHCGSFILMPELGIKLMTGDHVEPVHSRLIGVSSSMSQAILEQLGKPGHYRMMGCAVYNLYNVITGSFKRFVNPEGANTWDFLPGAMLALEQGCEVIINGEPFTGTFLDPRHKYTFNIGR